jgi:hypothetical protein
MANSNERPTPAGVLLGLFICWQLVFLGAANFLAILPHGTPEEGELSDSRGRAAPAESHGAVQHVLNEVVGLAEGWGYLTGQVQAWWLFSPDFPAQATFPTVELRWDEEADSKPSFSGGEPRPVRVYSILEPENPFCYFRPPSSLDRLFHYESRLGLILTGWNQSSVREYPDLWRWAIADRVRRQWKSIRAYLRWRVNRFQAEHPELPPPKQAVLLMRIYPTLKPDQSASSWLGPAEQVLARWRPGATESADWLPVEMCDPVTGRFEKVSSRRVPPPPGY